MSPIFHAKIHAKQWGGEPDEYIKIDEFIDSSKFHFENVAHRVLLHSSFGVMMAEQFFGNSFTNSVGRTVPIREVAINHIRQDLGFVPSVDNWLNNLQLQPWMSGTRKFSQPKPQTIQY